MQLAPASTTALIPGPKPSASHANFDVLELTGGDGATLRLGLVAGQRFFQQRGRSYEDAVAGAQKLAEKSGVAQAVLAVHPGLLFVAPAFTRDRTVTPVTSAKLAADLAPLAGLTPTARHGACWAIVGATQVIDMRTLPEKFGFQP